MQSLNVNFFGEQFNINIPKTLSALRESIAVNFQFDLKDVSELLITYTKDFKQFIIKTEEDFRNFISNKIFKLDLNIDEKSKIFQDNKKEIEDKKNLLKKLEVERKNIIENNNKEMLKGKEKLKEMKNKILEYQKEIHNENKKLIKIYNDNIKLLENKEKEINELRKGLDLAPIKMKEQNKALKKVGKETEKPKKIPAKKPPTKTKEKKVETKPEINNLFKNFIDSIPKIQEIFKNSFNNNQEKKQENDNNEKKPVHYCVRCDGCKCFPIRGIRYKCAVCNNFDYCEACEEKFSNVHQHPFIKINKPDLAPKKIQIILPENMPEFKK